jgi:hypothetical protein
MPEKNIVTSSDFSLLFHSLQHSTNYINIERCLRDLLFFAKMIYFSSPLHFYFFMMKREEQLATRVERYKKFQEE